MRESSGSSSDPFDGPCSAPPSYWVEAGAWGGLPGLVCEDVAACTVVDRLRCGQVITTANNAGGATSSHASYGCGEYSYSGPEIAFEFATDLAEAVTLSMSGQAADLDLFVLTSDACDGSGAVGCSTNPNADAEGVAFTATAGQRYVVVVDGYEGVTSGFSVTAACAGVYPGEDAPVDTGSLDTAVDTDVADTSAIDPTDTADPGVRPPKRPGDWVPLDEIGCGGSAAGVGVAIVAIALKLGPAVPVVVVAEGLVVHQPAAILVVTVYAFDRVRQLGGHMRDFGDVAVWQKAHPLVLDIYRATRAFPWCGGGSGLWKPSERDEPPGCGYTERMANRRITEPSRGPFNADQLRSGDPYELSRGHAIRVAPTGALGARGQGNAFAIVSSDPLVRCAGVDPGFKLESGTLRAPDVAIIPEDAGRGWIPGAPSLAIEYAGEGQDESELQVKIGELVAAGTRFLWIVRLMGPKRVEVYEEGVFRIAFPGEELAAPGLLQNAIPVSALFDPEEARELQLRNLLQRHGYRTIEEVSAAAFEEGREEGRESVRKETAGMLLETLLARGFALPPGHQDTIGRAPLPMLLRWLVVAGSVVTTDELFRSPVALR